MNDGVSARAAIVGIAGPEPVDEEIALFRELPPAGVILFRRNCEHPYQVGSLIAAFRDALGRPDLPILVDQEGGRVQRLGPPIWEGLPAAARIGCTAATQPERAAAAARLLGGLIAAQLREVGATVACTPVLDIGCAETTSAIGDRAFGDDPELVGRLGAALLDGLAEGQVAGVIKHMPGHGRAACDSHLSLPTVADSLALLRAHDFVPFMRCRTSALGMTAHILYPAIDPLRPATLSPRVISQVIRGEIGFRGILMSDDLAMGALQGSYGDRARSAVAAGCDLALHCSGVLDHSRDVLAAVPLVPMDRWSMWIGAAGFRAHHAAVDRTQIARRLADLVDTVVA